MNTPLLFTLDWRQRALSQRLIDSLAHLPMTLLIVVNDDEPANYHCSGPLNIVVAQQGFNSGFAAGCNTALRYAQDHGFSHAMHFNNDSLLKGEFDLLAAIKQLGEQLDKYSLLAPTVRSAESGTLLYAGMLPIDTLSPALIFARKKTCTSAQSVVPQRYINGACFIAKVDDVLACSGFDERFFAYREEYELCMRLRSSGKRIGYIPSIEIEHGGAASSRAVPAFKHFLLSRGQLLFAKTLKPLAAALYLSIMLPRLSGKYLLALLRNDQAAKQGLGAAFNNQLRQKNVSYEIAGEQLCFQSDNTVSVSAIADEAA